MENFKLGSENVKDVIINMSQRGIKKMLNRRRESNL